LDAVAVFRPGAGDLDVVVLGKVYSLRTLGAKELLLGLEVLLGPATVHSATLRIEETVLVVRLVLHHLELGVAGI